MKAEEFDTKFESDEDILDCLDLESARRPGLEQKRVNVDFPVWMLNSLDKVAKRTGVPRQAIIKVWLSERLAEESKVHYI